MDQSFGDKFELAKTQLALLKTMNICNCKQLCALPNLISESTILTDSATVLYWLRTPEIWCMLFIANRLVKFLVNHLHLIGDTCSRQITQHMTEPGLYLSPMTSESRWIRGPSFSSKHRSNRLKTSFPHFQYVKMVVDLRRLCRCNKFLPVIAFPFCFSVKCKKRSA